MKAFLVMLLVLSFCVAVHAQPQAPVTWGEPRWAYLAGWPGLPQITTNRVIPMGDTLLFTAVNVGSPVSDTILVCSSFDNGQTFTPWHAISQGNELASAHFAGSAGRYYAFFSQAAVPPSRVWLRTSDDGGLTWSNVQQYREDTYAMCGFASGSEVLAKYIGSWNNSNWRTCVIRSTDRGQSWSVPIVIDTADFYMYGFDQTIAFTAGHRLIVELPLPTVTPDLRLYVARSDSTGQNWTPFEVLPCAYYDEYGCQNRAAIIGDTASEAAGVVGVFGDWDASAPMTPFHYRTGDVAAGWEDCVQMGPPRIIPPLFTTYVPLNIGHGKLWMVGWERYNQPQWNYLAVRFSANHGRNWFPVQIPADSLATSMLFSGQIRGNQIDLYWAQGCCGQAQPWDYRMVTGTITPDTTFPEVVPMAMPPDSVRVGQQLEFSVMVTDNDTLSEVRLVIVELSGDTLRYGMERGAGHVYSFSWVVPDSGYYLYWFEAEDFWENIATLPDSGAFHFVTEGWSASSDFILHPSSFSLSVFPNPCNTWPALTLSPEWFVQGPVEITVYNALGQEVIRQTTTRAMVSFSPDIPAASGTYLLQVSNRRHLAMEKFVVLK